jgi:Ca2+-binding EF-hand superfamily protein
MVLKSPFNFIVSLILLSIGLLVVLPALAGGRSTLVPEDLTKDVPVDSDDTGLEQTLQHNFSPEDQARLRKALADYSKSTDPEHEQIVLRRKAMKESVEARFNGCDKDADDSIDREEATQCLPQIARRFSTVDIDEDGLITLDELELAQAKQIERQKAAEAKMEAEKIKEAEAAIKSKGKSKVNQQAANTRKRPS